MGFFLFFVLMTVYERKKIKYHIYKGEYSKWQYNICSHVTKSFQRTLCKPQLACYMLKFMTVQLEKH